MEHERGKKSCRINHQKTDCLGVVSSLQEELFERTVQLKMKIML